MSPRRSRQPPPCRRRYQRPYCRLGPPPASRRRWPRPWALRISSHLAGSRLPGRIFNRAAFDLRNPRKGYTPQCGRLKAVDFTAVFDKMLEHGRRNIKISDHTILSGRTATMEPGVRPIISFACEPTANTVSVRRLPRQQRVRHDNALAPSYIQVYWLYPDQFQMSFENMANIPFKQRPQPGFHRCALHGFVYE